MTTGTISRLTLTMLLASCAAPQAVAADFSYSIVDTSQSQCFDLVSNIDTCPPEGMSMHGQDAQYVGNKPSYLKQANGTVLDQVTGLEWNPSLDTNGDGKINSSDKVTYEQALKLAKQSRLAGFDDWRVPTIKELYSLMHFDGQDVSGMAKQGTYKVMPFIDQRYFDFATGDTESGERLIDSQYISATKYVSTTMPSKDPTVFGVNFIDGRIKGYPMNMPSRGNAPARDKTFFLLLVRGNNAYGTNQFVDQKNGTVADKATGLIWQQEDSQISMDWPEALAYCEDLELAGNKDWRLPNLKELQSIVDYFRSPDTTETASIDPIFVTTVIINEADQKDFGNYWSSTTHQNMRTNNGTAAGYIAFGRSMGFMRNAWIDVHGAGSQRTDPKVGDAGKYPTGRGPQGDSIRINNLVRCVSGGAEKVMFPDDSKREPFTIVLTGDEPSINSRKEKGFKPQGNSQVDRPQGLRRQPPKPAIDACKTLLNGNQCSVQTPRGKLVGQCREIDNLLACVPEHR